MHATVYLHIHSFIYIYVPPLCLQLHYETDDSILLQLMFISIYLSVCLYYVNISIYLSIYLSIYTM